MAKPAQKGDPFKTRRSARDTKKIDDTVTPPDSVREHIDQFREAQDQAKHFEGEATLHKDAIMVWGRSEFAKRFRKGQAKSFKVMGDESLVTYVVMNASSGLTEEDAEDIADRWGEDAAETLLERDFRSIRFNPDTLEAHYDEVVGALQTLPPDVLESLFRPMLLKAKPDALKKAKQYAQSEDEMEELITQLKLRHYIR